MYPADIMDHLEKKLHDKKYKGVVMPPKCIFLPTVKLVRQMTDIILEFGPKDSISRFLNRLGLVI
jgi:hypothetical protein